MRNFLLLSLYLTFFLPIAGQLRINEMMVKNISAVLDDSYNYSMWVELHNTGTESVNLSDYYFTDKTSKPQKWKTSAASIEAGAYHLLWFEREEVDGHANFKLDADGGSLYLITSTGVVVDRIHYPKSYRNTSYGRLSNGDSWAQLSIHSPGKSNSGAKTLSLSSAKPVFQTPAGFYNNSISLTFQTPEEGETIYYTSNGDEPDLNSNKYLAGTKINLNKTTVIRAFSYSPDKIGSEIVSNSYFIGERNFDLPVVSIVTDAKNLTDDEIGIYVTGSNGKINSTCNKNPQNYNQDWDRAANFEYFDQEGVQQLNQELDIAIAGGCSRNHALKSLKINPRNKHGNNKLKYQFFPQTRQEIRYKSLLFRNSGNDFSSTMMRDAFMHQLIMGRLNLDCQSYQPAVCFINGEYRGIQNLRERSNHDLIYSIYGSKEEDIRVIDEKEIPVDSEFQAMVSYARKNDISDSEVYAQVQEMLDVDSYLDYMMAEIYFNNGDWPHNNMKMWKPIDGKWRPVFFDVDFGFGLFDLPHSKTNPKNTLVYALSENLYRERALDNIYMLRRLMQNPSFKQKFIDRFCIHIASTFEEKRALTIMDNMSEAISNEISYHKSKYNQSNSSFTSGLNGMKKFAANRPDKMLGYIGDYFGLGTDYHTMKIASNIGIANYLFGSEEEFIMDDAIDLKYFKGQEYNIRANPVAGYKFAYWEVTKGRTTKVEDINYTGILTTDISLKAIYEVDKDPNSINTPDNNRLSVYPTAKGNSIIIKDANGLQMKLHDITGNLRLSQIISSNKEDIDLSQFSNGMYIISIAGKTFKVIKR